MKKLPNNITTLPPFMLVETVNMIRHAEYCPDALMKAIWRRREEEPEFVIGCLELLVEKPPQI